MKKKAIYHNIIGQFSNFVFLFLTSIVLLPYYFKFISNEEYGIWLGGISFLAIFSVFEANISFILTQQLGSKWTQKKTTEFSKYFSAALFFGLIAGLIIIISSYFFKDTLTSWVSSDKQIKTLFSDSFFLYAISISFTIIAGYLNCIPQVFLRTAYPPIFNLIASIVGITYTVWAVSFQGVMAIAIGNLVKVVLFFLLSSIYTFGLLKKNSLVLQLELNYVYLLIKEISYPFVSKVAMTTAMSLQNFIIAYAISASDTTIFDITKKIPFTLQMIINMIAVSTFTSFSLFYSEQNKSISTYEYSKYFFDLIRLLLLFSLTGIFLIGQDFITIWVGMDKFGGNLLLALICIVVALDQLRLVLTQQYYTMGKFNFTASADTIFAVSFLSFAVLLIPFFKVEGIVLAGVFANMLFFGFCFFLENKKGINLVSLVINKSLYIDIFIVILIAGITKFIYEYFRGNLMLGILTIVVSIALLVVIFYKRNRVLFNFMVLKFKR